MATLDDLRSISARLPGSVVSDGERFGLSVPVKGKLKGFVWAWAERVHPKKARVINNSVMAVSVPSLSAKEVILSSFDPSVVFTEPHYNGFPAVLVRLDAIDVGLLEDLVIQAWRCKASKALIAEFE